MLVEHLAQVAAHHLQFGLVERGGAAGRRALDRRLGRAAQQPADPAPCARERARGTGGSAGGLLVGGGTRRHGSLGNGGNAHPATRPPPQRHAPWHRGPASSGSRRTAQSRPCTAGTCPAPSTQRHGQNGSRSQPATAHSGSPTSGNHANTQALGPKRVSQAQAPVVVRLAWRAARTAFSAPHPIHQVTAPPSVLPSVATSTAGTISERSADSTA